MMKKLILLSSAIALSGVVLAGPMKHNHSLKGMLKELDLTVEQRQDIKSLMRQGRADAGLYREDFSLLKEQLISQIQAPDWDESAVTDILTEQQALFQQMALQKAQRKHQLWQLLSAEQQAEFQELMEDRQKPDREGRMQKMFKRLDLDEEQQAQVAQIKASKDAQRAEFAAEFENLKQAERALIQAEAFDETAWQTLYQQFAEKKLQAGLVKAQARHQVWNLLTESQQEKANQLMEKRKFRHKHREAHRQMDVI